MFDQETQETGRQRPDELLRGDLRDATRGFLSCTLLQSILDRKAAWSFVTLASSGGRGACTETPRRANRMPREKHTAPVGQTAPAPAKSAGSQEACDEMYLR